MSTHGHGEGTFSGNRLSSSDKNKTRGNVDEGIFVQKEIEMHSMTDLKNNVGYRLSYEDAASQKTEITAHSSMAPLGV
jgi:hypothetical protein